MTSGEETYALVIDLDGTALDDKGLLPDLNREALNRFVGDGGFLIVSTGRTRISAFSALDGVDLAAGCLTCDNGCTIYRGLELAGVRLPGVAPSDVEAVLAFCRDRSFRVNVFTETRNCAPLYFGNIVQCFANAVRCLVGAKSCIVTTLRALRLLMSEERVKKVWVRGLPADELGDLNKALSSSNAYVINDYGVVEIGSVESSKLAAVNLILKEKRVDPSHVYVVGDDGNDIGLLRSYPNSFAVANSRSEVMEAASYVVSSNNDCGVAEVVERIEADRKSEKAWS